MSAHDRHDEYGETFVAGLEWMRGEGYLSPGGKAEVARIVAGAPTEGARVLDVGCGLGDNDPRLVERPGPEAAGQRPGSASEKKIAADGGGPRPGHLRARKPA